MALTGASITNLKRSLDKYVSTNLETSESLNIDYEGLPFDNKSKSSWIMYRILDITPEYLRQGSSTQYAELANVLIQFNIFVHKGYTTTSEENYSIRDKIFKYFKVGKDIDLRDYQGDSSSLVEIRVREVVTDRPLPEENKYYNYAIGFNLQYTRLTTNP